MLDIYLTITFIFTVSFTTWHVYTTYNEFAFYLKSIFYRSRKPAQYHFFYHACIWNTLQFYIHVLTNNRYINRWSMISVLFCRIIYLLNINVSRLHTIYKSDLVSMFILKIKGCCSPLYEDWAETEKTKNTATVHK